jgi:hypothetical protein
MKFLQNKIDAQLAVDRVCETVRQLVAERSESVRIQSEAMRALMQQNRELHDRLLAVYAPTVAQTLPAMPSFQVDYRGPVGVENPSHNTPPVTQPVELPGTQVEGGE